MIRSLIAFLLLCIPSQSQDIVVANLSRIQRTDGWVTVTAPDRETWPTGELESNPGHWPVIRGDKVGLRGRFVHIRFGSIAPQEHFKFTIVKKKKINDGIEIKPIDPIDGVVKIPDPVDGELKVPGFIQGKINGEIAKVAIKQTAVSVVIGSNKLPLENWTILEEGPARVVLLCRQRVPNTQIVASSWAYMYTSSRVIGFELMLACSDQTNPETTQAIDSVELETILDLVPSFHFHNRRGGLDPTIRDGKLVTRLLGKTWIGHGQSFCWKGNILLWPYAKPAELLNLAAEMDAPVVGMCLNWRDPGAWGPWGVAPALHPHEDTDQRGHGAAAYVQSYKWFVDWSSKIGQITDDTGYGTARMPSQTGDQQGFGLTKLLPALAPRDGGPAFLYVLEPTILREGLRPSYHYENDLKPLDPGLHPKLVAWGCEQHYHPGVSEDQLGKAPWARKPTLGDYYAKDWAHMSSNTLAGWSVLTGDYLSRHLCEQEITWLILGTRNGRGLGEARGYGRGMLSGSWDYIATGDERFPKMVKQWFKSPAFSDIRSRIARGDATLPFGIYEPDGRKLGGSKWFWMPGLQEGLVISGLDAAIQVSNASAEASDIMKAVCKTSLFYGWWFYKERWTVGDAIHYLTNGTLLPDGSYDDPNEASPHWPGTAYDVWWSGSIKIAKRWVDDQGLKDKATKIDDSLIKMRFGWPKPVSFDDDRQAEWSAAR